jgi:CelD/BcsL family acetyltransferase involved in cellulose biosynthesis
LISASGHLSGGDSPAEWTALADDWNRLAGIIPFRRFEWLEPWWRHYSRDGWRLAVLVVEDAGRSIGIAPWYIARSGKEGRVLRSLGSGEVCSEYQTVLTQPGREADVATALADWLDTTGAEQWDLLHLPAAEADDPAVTALTDEFVRRGHATHVRPAMSCWRAELAPDWEEFLGHLSSSRRARVRQLTRKYFDSGRVVTHAPRNPVELDRGFRLMVDLHQRRRQSLGQAGCFVSSAFLRFHEEVCRRFFALGMLRLLSTELDNRPVAAEYALIGGQTVYYYQTGLEPEARQDDPGWLGMIGSVQRAINEGYRSFDFLRGDEAYKSSWGAQPQMTAETRIVARHAAARLRHTAWLTREGVRQWARRNWARLRSDPHQGR